VLRFWYSVVDCTSFGLFPEVALLLGGAGTLLAAGFGYEQVAMVVAVEDGVKKLVNGLPKQQKLQVDCPHILVYRENSTKKYVKPASADSVGLLLRQSLFVSEW
jgi:hypothetical protein